MIGMRGDQLAIPAFGVAGPNLVAVRAGQVKGDAAMIGADAETIREAFADFGKGTGIGAVEVHAEDLAEFATWYLHENSFVADEGLRRVKNFVAVFGGDLGEGFAVQIVEPEMRGRQRVELIEGPAGTVTAFFHAQENHAAAVGKERTGLPGDLVRHIEFQNYEAGAIRLDQAGFSSRGKKESLVFGD
jgi:hypothetical protein